MMRDNERQRLAKKVSDMTDEMNDALRRLYDLLDVKPYSQVIGDGEFLEKILRYSSTVKDYGVELRASIEDFLATRKRTRDHR